MLHVYFKEFKKTEQVFKEMAEALCDTKHGELSDTIWGMLTPEQRESSQTRGKNIWFMLYMLEHYLELVGDLRKKMEDQHQIYADVFKHHPNMVRCLNDEMFYMSFGNRSQDSHWYDSVAKLLSFRFHIKSRTTDIIKYIEHFFDHINPWLSAKQRIATNRKKGLDIWLDNLKKMLDKNADHETLKKICSSMKTNLKPIP